jgi:hypothetical protein
MHRALWVLLFTAILISVQPASAQFFTGPAASASGGGGRAAVDPGEATFLNPASIAFLQRYNVSGYYDVGRDLKEGDHNLWGVSLADGTADNIMPGALSFIRKRTDAPSGASDTQQDIQFAVAGMAGKKLAFGLAVHRLSDQILSNFEGQDYTQINGHLGMIYIPIPEVGIGFVAYDIAPTSSVIPHALREVPTLALGANYLWEKVFRARLDLVRPDVDNNGRRINVQAGIESLMTQEFIFRTGCYWRETEDQTFFTVGAGYNGPRLSFDYSFQKDLRSADNFRHVVDLWLPL